MTVRLLRKLFSADALGLGLVLGALQTMTYGVASSLRGTDTAHLFWVCLVAALIGWMLNKGRLNGIQASAAVAALGVIGLWIVGARITYPLLAFLRSITGLMTDLLPVIGAHDPVDTSQLLEIWTVIVDASSALASRWQSWFAGINTDVTVNDALIRTMIWTFGMWAIAAWTGWFVARRNAILSLLPNVILLAVVISYSERKAEALWLMVFIMLLLMGVWNYKNHTIQWERRRVDYSDSIRYDNTQAVVALATLVGIIAFTTPSLSWREIRDFLRERDRSNEAAEVLGIQPQPASPRDPPVQKPSLPREHLLTGGFALSEEIVMTIRTGELAPSANPFVPVDAPRYYWRSTIYDRYMGAGWVTSSAPPVNQKANTPLIPGLLDGYRPLHLDVQLQQPEGKLFWSGILYNVDIPFRADWRIRPQSNLFADQTALLQADIFSAASGASSYQADVYIPTATIEELRNASKEYPEQVRSRYLALPQELPGRVRDLAWQITHEDTTPYDKAKAIENYLRTNYPYDLDVPVPPEDQDVADYFLFDLRKGYCDYYATAMVVLARASGLPARFVSGYASGTYDATTTRYSVRELDAHSWVEVYFPEIGWIEFEPTGSQPEIERLERESEIINPDEPVTPASRLLFQLTSKRVLYLLSPFIITILLIILYFAFIERLLFMSLAPSKAIEILYRRYYRLGRPFAGERTRAETAYEFSTKLIRNLEEANTRTHRTKSLQRLRTDVNQLTDVYLLSLFGKHVTQTSDARTAFITWKRLRRRLITARVNKFLLRATQSLLSRMPLRGIKQFRDRINS